SSGDEAVAEGHLAASTNAQAVGARVVGLAYPALGEVLVTFASTAPLTGLPEWSSTMRLAHAQRMRALRDPETRERLEAGAAHAARGPAHAGPGGGRGAVRGGSGGRP